MKVPTLLIAIFVLFIVCMLSAVNVSADAPPAGYAYVKSHSITGSPDSTLSNYQVKLVVHSDSGSDNGKDVYLNGHSLSWPNDLRFTNDANTPLSYWVESSNASMVVIWVKVDNIPVAPGMTTIRLYYGKAGETSVSNGQSTFLFYDDFSNLNQWTSGTSHDASVTCDGSEVELKSRSSGSNNDWARIMTNNNYPYSNVMVWYRYRAQDNVVTGRDDEAADSGVGTANYDSANSWRAGPFIYKWSSGQQTQYRFILGGSEKYRDSVGVPDNVWTSYVDSKAYASTSNIYAYENDVLKWSGTWDNYADGQYQAKVWGLGPNAFQYFLLRLDSFIIAKWTQNPPQQTTWSNEQPITPTPTPTPMPIPTPISGYTYVKSHAIIGSTDGVQTDYQVRFVVHNGTGSDNGQDVYLNSHSMSWPNDIRFTDANNNLLQYWVESSDASAATIWVNLSTIPSSPDMAIVNVFYGKANEVSASNGYSTFPAFDDFSDDSRRTTFWTESQGAGTNGITDVHRFENGGYHIKQNSQSDRGVALTLANRLNIATRCNVTLVDVSESGGRSPPWVLTGVSYNTIPWGYGNWGGIQSGYDTLPGHTYLISWNDGSTTNSMQLFENGALLTTSNANFNSGHKPSMGVHTGHDAMGEWYFKNFYARTYTTNEPQHGEWRSAGVDLSISDDDISFEKVV